MVLPEVTLNSIHTAYTFCEVSQLLSQLNPDAVIFFDVDDTLITPESKLFRYASPYRFLIDDLKKNRQHYPNFEAILSHWRLERRTMLLSPEWPDLIQDLKARFDVFALTKMETGSLGKIPSMEEWRYKELKSKGITFTPHFQNLSETLLVKENAEDNPSTFYRGIFITGSFPKNRVVREVLKGSHSKQVVLIDDRLEHLQDVEKECLKHNLPFLGIHFKGMEHISGQPDLKVGEFQKISLLERCHWIEDDEAERLLKQA